MALIIGFINQFGAEPFQYLNAHAHAEMRHRLKKFMMMVRQNPVKRADFLCGAGTARLAQFAGAPQTRLKRRTPLKAKPRAPV
jgi:hypothetical protein